MTVKSLISSLFIFFLSISALAGDLLYCSDADIVLSPNKPQCFQENRVLEFDIPELQIDIIDLEKIFLPTTDRIGSESSGGGRTLPHQSRVRMSRLPELNCELSVLANGQKTIHYLSTQNLLINKSNTNIDEEKFTHYLTKELSLNPKTKYLVEKSPEVDLSNLVIQLSATSTNFNLKLCEISDSTTICTSNSYTLGDSLILKLLSYEKVTEDFEIEKRIQLICR